MSNSLGKILFHSNSPHSPTGYGNQTRLFTPLILAAGYDLTCFSFYGTEGGIIKNQYGITELPRHGDQYGNDIIVADMQFSQSELLITLIDPFVLDPDNLKRVNWCAWVPVDCTPLNDENNRSLQGTRFVWSMSKFGHQQLEQAGYKPIYVPHGIDSTAFYPLENRQEPREKLGKHWRVDLKDKFLVVTVAANKGRPSRKNFFGMFQAFAEFAKTHPDALFYIHTDETPLRFGASLRQGAARFGIADKVIFPDGYHLARNMYTDSYLNDVYNAADVFMLLSMGEGFGIPIVEAQMAGCPVIVSDGSACAELCLSGWKVGTIPTEAYDGREWCFWHLPILPLSVQALELAYLAKDDITYRDLARVRALDYDHLRVWETYMKPAIEMMLAEIRKPVEVPPVVETKTVPMNRKEARQKRVARAAAVEEHHYVEY